MFLPFPPFHSNIVTNHVCPLRGPDLYVHMPSPMFPLVIWGYSWLYPFGAREVLHLYMTFKVQMTSPCHDHPITLMSAEELPSPA